MSAMGEMAFLMLLHLRIDFNAGILLSVSKISYIISFVTSCRVTSTIMPISNIKHTAFTAACHVSGTLRLNSSNAAASTNKKKILPPSRAGMGSIFMTARLMAIRAAK